MRNVLLAIAALALATATSAADESSTPPNRLTFHVASLAPDTGLQEMVIEGTDKQIFIENTPALSRKDYASVCFETDDKGHTSLIINMTQEGSTILERISAANIGRQLAIKLNDRIIMAPQIRGVMTKAARIDGRFSNKDLRRLFDALVLLNDRELAAK